MKIRIILSALLVIILSAGISSSASAHGWRGYHRGGWYAPRPVVRVYAPRVFVPPVPVVVAGGYYGRPAYGHGCYRHAYYGHHCYR